MSNCSLFKHCINYYNNILCVSLSFLKNGNRFKKLFETFKKLLYYRKFLLHTTNFPLVYLSKYFMQTKVVRTLTRFYLQTGMSYISIFINFFLKNRNNKVFVFLKIFLFFNWIFHLTLVLCMRFNL